MVSGCKPRAGTDVPFLADLMPATTATSATAVVTPIVSRTIGWRLSPPELDAVVVDDVVVEG